MSTEWVKRNKTTDLYEWVQEGQVLEGTVVGYRDGRFGKLLILDTGDEGEVTVAVKTALSDIPNEVGPGDALRIEYLGQQQSKAGRTFFAFDWFTSPDPDSGEGDSGVA